MQKSDHHQRATKIHRKVQPSTTLNRKYVKRPTSSQAAEIEVAVKRSPRVKHFDVTPVDDTAPAQSATKIQVQDDQSIEPAAQHPMQATAISRMQSRKKSQAQRKLTAKELKDQAIQKALADSSRTIDRQNAAQASKQHKAKLRFGVGRVVLALSCAVAAVFAIVYFVGLNMPDITMRVAAMQTGIQASYPGYIPRGFNLSDITSESGKVTLNFTNSETGTSYSLTEENSSWDSNALLANLVKPEYGDDYTILREQGLTIYVSDNDASWVNGGIVYKLHITSGDLTKKQISSIAVSL